MTDTKSDFAALIAGVKEAFSPRQITITPPDDRPGQPVTYLLSPDGTGGMRMHNASRDLEALSDHPERATGEHKAQTLDAFIALVAYHDSEYPVVFFDSAEPPSLLAIFNYHGPHGGAPGHCDHRASFHFPISVEWKRWTKANRTQMTQTEFAQFLSDNVLDVVDPPAVLRKATEDEVPEELRRIWQYQQSIGGRMATRADMMRLADGLEIRAEARVKNRVNLQSGRAGILFEEDHLDSDGKPLEIPSMFLLSLPVFENGPRYAVPAHLRYRIANGAVKWSFDLHRHDLARKDALEAAAADVQAQTGLPVFAGTPS